jgi:uncharacterized protein Yka (UPF0111/DUF47 family)
MRLSIVPQERRFYDLFKRMGDLTSETLSELSKSLLEGRSRHPRLRDLEHEADDVTHEIYTLVDRTFVTPLEQEDILLLAASLDDIVDLAEEVSDKVELYRCTTIAEPARKMGELLDSAGTEIKDMLDNLEGFKDLEAHRIEVHRLENEGDTITREALAHLFADDAMSAPELIKWKDIYDLLEATLDGCEHVANVMERISIKNA